MRRLVLILLSVLLVFSKKLNILNLSNSVVDYYKGLSWQNAITEYQLKQRNDVQCNSNVGTIVFLQHDSIYTLGSSTTSDCGPFQKSGIGGLFFDTTKIERGGKITYHGPGQLVVYPIIDLVFLFNFLVDSYIFINHYFYQKVYFEKDINFFLRSLENIIIDTLLKFNINAKTINGLTGVWVDDYKVAAIGIKITRWITYHGFSININPNMNYFNNIIPCGINDKKVGYINQFVPNVSIDEITKELIKSFEKNFSAESNHFVINNNDNNNFIIDNIFNN
jgi:lipoyl(octanoyl) transferase